MSISIKKTKEANDTIDFVSSIIINKLEGVVEYLGENYPLYFTNLNEINSLLSTNKLIDAYNYLKIMDKKDLSIKYFTSKFINYIVNLNNNIIFNQKLLCIYIGCTINLNNDEHIILDIIKYFILFKNSKVIIFIIEKYINEIKLDDYLMTFIQIFYNDNLEYNQKIKEYNNKLPIIDGLANKLENNFFYCLFPMDLNNIYINNTLSSYNYIILKSDFVQDIYLKYTNIYIYLNKL
jgi:hypothetical protein